MQAPVGEFRPTLNELQRAYHSGDYSEIEAQAEAGQIFWSAIGVDGDVSVSEFYDRDRLARIILQSVRRIGVSHARNILVIRSLRAYFVGWLGDNRPSDNYDCESLVRFISFTLQGLNACTEESDLIIYNMRAYFHNLLRNE